MIGRIATATLLAVGLAAVATAAQAQTVSVAVVATFSGPAASLGQQLRDGFALGVESVGGKLGGLPTTVTVIDDELKPDVAVTKLRGTLESEHDGFVVGPIFSNVLAAIVKPVTEANAFLLSPNAGSSAYAGRGCNPNLFVTSYQNDQIHAVLGQFAQESGYKRMFVIAPNYQAGRDAVAGFKSKFKGEVTDEVYVPLNQIDFQAELAKIASEKPDAVFAFMPGGLGIALVKQYRQAGLAGIPFLSTFTVDESVLPAEGDAAAGFYSGANWTPDLDVPANKAFVAAFEKKYGYIPASYAAQAYDTAVLIDSAIKSAGGVGDRAKLRAALERADFASVRGAFKFGVNHFPVQDFYLAQVVKRPDGKYQTEMRRKVFANDVDPYAAQCKMP
jgi:branched-chain amino acid transport system substrate-binding protein